MYGPPSYGFCLQDRYITIPNALTMIRMVLAPYVAYCLLHDQAVAAVYSFAVAGALDGIDGWVARRFNQSSVIGSYLDPLADKILVGCTSCALMSVGALPWWSVLIIVGRDAGLIAGGLWHRYTTKPQGVPFFSTSHASTMQVEPSPLSKANTALQVILLTCGLTGAAWGVPTPHIMTGMAALVTGTTFASGYGYWQKIPYAAIVDRAKQVARKGAAR